MRIHLKHSGVGPAFGRSLVRFALALGVAGVVAACSKSSARPAIHLTKHTIPGLSIDLPDWPMEGNYAGYEDGKLRLLTPPLLGKPILLNWYTVAGDHEVPLRQIHKALTQAGYAKEPQVVNVGGHPGERWHVTGLSGAAAETIWQCPEDGRTFALSISLEMSLSEVEKVADAAVRSVHCHLEGHREPHLAPMPVLPDKPGWRMETTASRRRYFGPMGQRLEVGTGRPGDIYKFDTAGEEQRWAALNLAFPATVSEDAQLTKRTVDDVSGHTRTVWYAKEEDRSTARHDLVMMTWFCPVQNRSYLATDVLGPAHDGHKPSPTCSN